MNVICMNDEAFYALIETVLSRLSKNNEEKSKWVSAQDAMKILNIKSKSTLQKLRDGGKIEYTQPNKKLIQYDVNSLFEYLEKYKMARF